MWISMTNKEATMCRSSLNKIFALFVSLILIIAPAFCWVINLTVISEGDKTPLYGAEVTITSGKKTKSGVTEAEGMVTIEVRFSPPYKLEVRVPSNSQFLPYVKNIDPDEFNVSEECSKTIIIEKRKTVIKGEVIDRDKGIPISNVTVNINPQVDNGYTETDTYGKFEIKSADFISGIPNNYEINFKTDWQYKDTTLSNQDQVWKYNPFVMNLGDVVIFSENDLGSIQLKPYFLDTAEVDTLQMIMVKKGGRGGSETYDR